MKKIIKKSFAALMGTTIIAAAGSMPVFAADSAAEAYNSVLGGYTANSEEDGYALLDLNQDGVKELLILSYVASGRYLVPQVDVYACVESNGYYDSMPLNYYSDTMAVYAAGDGNGFFTCSFIPANGQMEFFRHVYHDGSIEDKGYPEFVGIMGSEDTNGFIYTNPPLILTPFTEPVSDVDVASQSDVQNENYDDDSWDAVEVDPAEGATDIEAGQNMDAGQNIDAAQNMGTATDVAVSGLVAGLSEYDLITILEYGPEDFSGYFDDRCAHQLLNGVLQSGRVETHSYAYKPTINRAFMNSLANAYGGYDYSGPNFDIIERGEYICYAPAQINFTPTVDNITVESYDGSYALVYHYYCHKSDPNVSESTIDCMKRANLAPIGDGTYRIVSFETIG